MTMVAALTSMGNWSVSQPRSGEPVLASMEPSILILSAKRKLSERDNKQRSDAAERDSG